jgi:hypothetical protein
MLEVIHVVIEECSHSYQCELAHSFYHRPMLSLSVRHSTNHLCIPFRTIVTSFAAIFVVMVVAAPLFPTRFACRGLLYILFGCHNFNGSEPLLWIAVVHVRQFSSSSLYCLADDNTEGITSTWMQLQLVLLQLQHHRHLMIQKAAPPAHDQHQHQHHQVIFRPLLLS